MSSAATRQDRIDAEAAGWLAAIECGTADRQAFEQWRSADPGHALAFLRAAQVSRGLDALHEAGLTTRPAPPPEVAADDPVNYRRRFLKVGVVGGVAAGLAGLGMSYAAAAQDAETGVGEQRRIMVADGIALELNTDSHVSWRRRDGAYAIELLRGEVMLERQPGSAPCRLECGQSKIDLAAGGRMVARSKPQGVDLSVLAGEAYLRTPASPIAVRVATLRKAQVVGETHSVSPISQLDAAAASAWQQGQLQFNGESLDDAVAEYNRYLPRRIEIADKSIGDIRLGGRFSATDPADFYQALDRIYGVSAQVEPDRTRLIRDQSKKSNRL